MFKPSDIPAIKTPPKRSPAMMPTNDGDLIERDTTTRPRIAPMPENPAPKMPDGAGDPPPQMFTGVEPPEQPANAGTSPMFESQPSVLEQKRAQLAEMMAKPAEKQNPWLQAAFMGLQALGNITSGQNRPIEWLGNAKKQFQVDQVARDLAPLEAMEQTRIRNEAQEAQTADIRNRPEMLRRQMEQQTNMALLGQVGRSELENQRTRNRLEVLNRSADIKAGEAEFYTRDDGTVWKRYKKADSSGQTRAEEQQFTEDGSPLVFRDQAVSPYRDPVTGQTVFAKPRDIITAGQGQQRIEETKRSNAVNEDLKRQNLSLARERFANLLEQQRLANAESAAARAANDANRQAQAAERQQKLDLQIKQIKSAWKSKIGTGDFTQADYDALVADMPQ